VNAKPVEEEELDERFLHPDYFEGSYGYFQHMPRNYFPFFEYRKQWLDKRGKAEFKAWCKDKTKEVSNTHTSHQCTLLTTAHGQLALLAKHILSELPPAAYTESEHILVLHVGGDWTTYIFNEDKDMSKHLLPEPSDETWKEHKVENEISFKLLGYETHMVSNINKEKEAFARGCGGTGTLFDLSVFSFLYVAHEIYANDSYDGTAKLAYDTEFAFRTISDVKPRVSCGNEEPDWLQGTPEEIVSYINSL
jgi:hypothetical protein